MDNLDGNYQVINDWPDEHHCYFTELKDRFLLEFKELPDFYVRVPGRVNIIGEHVDYNGYPVLPMAINKCIYLACSYNSEPTLNIRNVNKMFGDFDGAIGEFRGSNGIPKWYDYFLCGIHGIIKFMEQPKKNGFSNKDELCLQETTKTSMHLRGLKVYVKGTIPPAAGLSSSSALVCSAALAMAYARNAAVSKLELARICADSERLVGTQGGGMDQAIAFLGKEGYAQYITFEPLSARPVRLPKNLSVVIAHSHSTAHKACDQKFNSRVKGCRIAAKKLVESEVEANETSVYTIGQAQKILNVDLPTLEILAEKLPELEDGVRVKDRAMHCIQEAQRVEDFVRACNKNVKLPELGNLISKSHNSLRVLYECSNASLDRLVQMVDASGAFARLTGAGWGGCVVVLVETHKAQSLIDQLKLFYYGLRRDDPNFETFPDVFASTPQNGATIHLLTNI